MELLILTTDHDPTAVLPALGLLRHTVRHGAPRVAAVGDTAHPQVVLIDARTAPHPAASLCRLIANDRAGIAIIAVLTEHALSAVTHRWAVTDVVLCTAGPAEIEARLRLARRPTPHPEPLELGELQLDQQTHTLRLRDRQIAMTHPEFELLTHLARHPGQVFTRQQLLTQLWGPDHTSGPRTIDGHVKRLRKKLGTEHENIISAVHNVGYKLISRAVDSKAARTVG